MYKRQVNWSSSLNLYSEIFLPLYFIHLNSLCVGSVVCANANLCAASLNVVAAFVRALGYSCNVSPVLFKDSTDLFLKSSAKDSAVFKAATAASLTFKVASSPE